MEKFIVSGGKPLCGEILISGAKNVALKVLVASLLTNDSLLIHNIPHIRDVLLMIELLQSIGIQLTFSKNTVSIRDGSVRNSTVPLEIGARLRTSALVIGPMLSRFGEAKIPNPGGCRIGARPIDRHIDALRSMGATITYNSSDGFFHAKAKKLHGATITFPKNTHTGTETIILAAVLAQGETVIHNAAAEVEIDDLIACLNRMGANIQRRDPRTIIVQGVDTLHGTEYTIMPDRNEEITFAIAAAISDGNIIVHNSRVSFIHGFIQMFQKAGGKVECLNQTTTRYRRGNKLCATNVVTQPFPGFMTDWQAPWAVFMTQAHGKSTIHETVFESRFSYVGQLVKMGAKIEFFNPQISDPETYYNFNWSDKKSEFFQGIRITGPTNLHNAIITIDDLRAGATLVLASLVAQGTSYIYGIEQIDRGYEKIDERLQKLGAVIRRQKE